MALFNKKYCDICGGSMGIIIDNKAADGNYCHACAHKLSPYFHGGKNATLQQIKEQLAYRENNRQQLNMFTPSQILGNQTKVYIDPGHNCFVVSKSSNYKNDNADIINFSQLVNVTSETKEHKKEIYYKDAEGHNKSYNPRKYEYSYEIFVTINVNSPYFNKIEFEVTKDPIRNQNSAELIKYQNDANQIVAALTGRPAQQAGGIAGGVAGAVGGIAQAAAGVAGVAGLAGIAGALLGNQAANNQQMQQGYAQQNMGVAQGFAQPNMGGVQGYAQQNVGGVAQGFAQPNMGGVQGYPQQQMQQGFAQQNMGAAQAYGNQAYGSNQAFGNQAFGGQWVCPNCGTTNTGNFCQGCGMQKQGF